MELNKYTPNFKIVAGSPEEAIEISNFFVNLMNRMPYAKLLKAARKVNEAPEKKVAKMSNYISLL
jgi:hypothetical protein